MRCDRNPCPTGPGPPVRSTGPVSFTRSARGGKREGVRGAARPGVDSRPTDPTPHLLFLFATDNGRRRKREKG